MLRDADFGCSDDTSSSVSIAPKSRVFGYATFGVLTLISECSDNTQHKVGVTNTKKWCFSQMPCCCLCISVKIECLVETYLFFSYPRSSSARGFYFFCGLNGFFSRIVEFFSVFRYILIWRISSRHFYTSRESNLRIRYHIFETNFGYKYSKLLGETDLINQKGNDWAK